MTPIQGICDDSVLRTLRVIEKQQYFVFDNLNLRKRLNL
ncbi:hypothetical protein T11_13458 [Trichinella zimbabwensis]|uniref:Uncharacterized protein n=1 Tax=Trichinella zimbabwensis TaxID=268475 RepID=A0A0V1GLZ4_9BILA|nr:hypothetical protein T11_13458 [Trichinella zimbabwensis]